MADKIYLTMKSGPEEGQQFFFEQKNIAIGRAAAENDLILNDPSVSNKHAIINYREGRFFLQNLNSTNGVFFNGVRLGDDEEVILNQGDEFAIGRLAIEFSRIPDRKKGYDEKTLKEKVRLEDNQKRKRILIIAGALLFVIILIKVCSKPGQPVQSKDAFYSDQSKKTIPLPATGDYGLTGKGDKSHPDKAVFSFIAESGMVNLHYAVGGIDSKGEVVILLNGTKIANVPIAINRWQDNLVLPLQHKLIVIGEKNHLVFENVKNPPGLEKWGVKKLRVEFLPTELCDENEGKRLLGIAKNLYDERNISMKNLFKASQYFRKALAKVVECQPEPNILAKAEKRFSDTLEELDSMYDGYIVAFKKLANLREYKEAAEALRAIKNLFPDERDYRNKEAKRLFDKLKRFLGGEKT